MNIHEYQAKELLAKYGVAVPLEIPAKNLDELRLTAEKISASGSSKIVVKSQIHAGGRGKGTFKSGFQGGVKVASSVDEAVSFAEKMFGQILVTKQTGADGRKVQTPCFWIAPIRVRSSWPAPKAAWTSKKSLKNIPKRFSKNTLIPPSASCRFRRGKLPIRSVSKAIYSTPLSNSSLAFITPGGNVTPRWLN
jgi:hypothetical protein